MGVALCLQDARGRLIASQSSIEQLRKQLAESDLAKRETEQRNQSLQRERDAAQREKEATLKEKERLKQERDGLARSADTPPPVVAVGKHHPTNTLGADWLQ